MIIAAKEVRASGPSLVFARHETFHPRYGWLKKGFDAVRNDPEVFSREDAPVVLGVGKNMVRAIRYWCVAFKILEEDRNKRGALRATDFGNVLFSEPKGLDQYVEQSATLWLLHWKLLAQPCQATAWNYSFVTFNRTEFNIVDLSSDLTSYVQEAHPGFRLADSSIKKDVACIIRMYSESRDISMVREETIDSPFSELCLIRRGTEKGQFRFNVGEKANLPEEIIVSCCLEFAHFRSTTARTTSLANLLYSPGSPGQVFRLDEHSLYAAIERVSLNSDVVSLSETAGLVQLSFHKDPIIVASKMLTDYYQGRLA